MPLVLRHPVASLLGVLLLAACATPTPAGGALPKYEPPNSPDAARLVMRGLVPTGDAYVVRVLDDGEHCERPQLVGTGNSVQHPESTTLPAGQPVTLAFQLVKPSNQSCFSRWTFTPAAGKSYLFTGIGLPTGCVALVNDMSDVEHLKLEPTALHRNPKGGPSCLPIAESKPMPVAASASAASAGEAVLRNGADSNDLQGLIKP